MYRFYWVYSNSKIRRQIVEQKMNGMKKQLHDSFLDLERTILEGRATVLSILALLSNRCS